MGILTDKIKKLQTVYPAGLLNWEVMKTTTGLDFTQQEIMDEMDDLIFAQAVLYDNDLTRMMWSAFNLGAQFADLHRREQDEQATAKTGSLNMPPWQE